MNCHTAIGIPSILSRHTVPIHRVRYGSGIRGLPQSPTELCAFVVALPAGRRLQKKRGVLDGAGIDGM
jgi:hypothetical protein